MKMLQALTIMILGIVTYQDFKFRAISWPLLLLLMLLLLLTKGFQPETGINLLFVAAQLVFLTLYISLKNKRFTNIIDTYLGLGDILFLVVICAAFSTYEFIIFYTAGLLFSLLAFMIYRLVNRKASAEIPLAGLMSIAMIALLIINQ